MTAEADRPAWGPHRLLGGLLHWRLLQAGGLQVTATPTPLRVLEPDCDALFSGNQAEVRVTKEMVYKETREQGMRGNWSCSQFEKQEVNLGQELLMGDYPLAYLIYARHQPEQLTELLRAVYTVNNTYCVYTDRRSPEALRAAVERIASCSTHNVLVAPPGRTDLHAQHECLRLFQSTGVVKWRHLVHLSDQYFPLVTNSHITTRLQPHPEAGDVPGVPVARVSELRGVSGRRYNRSALLLSHHNASQLQVPKELERLTLYRGDYCFIVSRAFIDYSLRAQKAKILFQWTQRTFKHPSLFYWPTLFTQAGFVRKRLDPVVMVTKQSLLDPDYQRRCVEESDPTCVFGVDDLAWLSDRKQLFAGRFDVDVDHVVLHCLSQRHRNALGHELTNQNIPSRSPDIHNLYYK